MKLSSHGKKISSILLLFALVILLLLAWLNRDILFEPALLKDFISSAGILGPFIYIGVIVLEVVIAPLPGIVFPLISGFLFGFWHGVLYSYIGNVLGSSLAFFLARSFGQPLVSRLMKKEKLVHANAILEKYQKHLFWLYALPIFPIDVISFLLGLSALRFRRFFLIVALGFIPYLFLLNLLGDRISTSIFKILVLGGFLVVAVIAIYLILQIFRRKK